MKRTTVSQILLYAIITFILAGDFLSNDFSGKDWRVIASFAVIACINIFEILSFNATISLQKMIQIFSFVFFYYCGLRQYCQGVLIWDCLRMLNLENSDFLFGNIIIILFLLLFSVAYRLFLRKKKSKEVGTLPTCPEIIRSGMCEWSSVICVALVLIFVRLYSLQGLLSSYRKGIEYSQSLQLILDNFIRTIPFCFALAFVTNRKKLKQVHNLAFIIVLLSVFVLAFPFGGVSRYRVACVYLSLLFLMLPEKHRSRSMLFLIMIACLFIVFPSMSFFRYRSVSDIRNWTMAGLDYKSGDYDAYLLLVSIIKYARTNGLLYGKNLLTALLFFVPRSVWPNKLVGSGAYLAENLNADFANISCPFISEFFFSFGVIGVILGALLLAWISQAVDLAFRSASPKRKGAAAIVISFSIFVMRGDLLSSFAYLSATLLAYYLTTRLFYQRPRT